MLFLGLWSPRKPHLGLPGAPFVLISDIKRLSPPSRWNFDRSRVPPSPRCRVRRWRRANRTSLTIRNIVPEETKISLPRSDLTSLCRVGGTKRRGQIMSQEDLFLLVPARPPRSFFDSSLSFSWMINSILANILSHVSRRPDSFGQRLRMSFVPRIVSPGFPSLSLKRDFYVSAFLFSVAFNKTGPSHAHDQHSVFSSLLGLSTFKKKEYLSAVSSKFFWGKNHPYINKQKINHEILYGYKLCLIWIDRYVFFYRNAIVAFIWGASPMQIELLQPHWRPLCCRWLLVNTVCQTAQINLLFTTYYYY